MIAWAETLDALRLDVANLAPDETFARLVEHAAEYKASDLYFVTNETHVAVAARHLGVVRLVTVLPTETGRRCMAHVRALAGMDLAERRRPQEGRRIFACANGTTLDIRVSTLPTLYGEDFSLRLLDRESRLLSLDALGLLRHDHNNLMRLLGSPGGLVLVTGPTGAGKTTTLYACLAHLNNGERKINTIEDPIEYALPGVRQSQVNARIDVDFPDLLRAVLRQAPDVIMVGEVRDAVTAETAVRAANSGHLVLATLHAPVAAGAVQSMLALGVHPHLLASALLGAVSQRLVRTLCPDCKAGYDLGDAPVSFDEVKRWLGPDEGQKIYGPRGCPACLMTGYADRTGVFEVMTLNRELRQMIVQRQPVQELRRKAVEDGMIEFRKAALLKVGQGVTSVEEVLRVVPTEYLGLDDTSTPGTNAPGEHSSTKC